MTTDRLGVSDEQWTLVYAAQTDGRQPDDHTAARSRTIPNRLWRGIAALNDLAGLTEIDWRHLCHILLWMLRLTLLAGAVATYADGQLSRTLIAILAMIAINTLPHTPAARGDV